LTVEFSRKTTSGLEGGAVSALLPTVFVYTLFATKLGMSSSPDGQVMLD
jgi:hypothetical protein